jgi:hypothetical protein
MVKLVTVFLTAPRRQAHLPPGAGFEIVDCCMTTRKCSKS